MKNELPRRLLGACLLAAATLAQAQSAADFPNHPIRFILPSAAGGGGDLVGRLMSENLGKHLRQSLVPDNNAAASGTVAISQLARSRPDGYTIGLGTMTATTLAPAVYPKLPYDPLKDLVPIGGIGTSPIMLLVAKEVPAKDLQEFLAYARRSPQPVQYGSWGLGSTGNFCGEVLAQKTGVKLNHVPYKGTAPVTIALLGGEIKVAWLDMASATAVMKSGKVKPLAMCTRRTANFPQVATYKEQGVDFDQWTGWAMYAPAGTPRPVLDKLSMALKETLADPAVAATLLDWGITADFVSSDEQAAIDRKGVEIWKNVAREANIRSE